MSGESRSATLSSGLLIGLVVAIVAAAVAGFLWLRNPSATNSSNTNGNGNSSDIQPTDISVGWPTFTSPYRVSVPMPRGMRPCDDGNGIFSLRNDDCSSAASPSLRFRRSDTWDGMTAEAVLDEVFAQELREAGLEKISGVAAPVSGRSASGIVYTFNDQLTVAVMTEQSPPSGVKARNVAIEANRQSPPQVDGVPQDIDDALMAVVQGIVFSVPRPASNVNASGS